MNNKNQYGSNPLCPSYYFSDPVISDFPAFIDDNQKVWEVLESLEKYIISFVQTRGTATQVPSELQVWNRRSLDGGTETVLYASQGLETNRDLVFPQLSIFISRDVVIEPTALLKGPLLVGRHTEIRHGAYLRGNVLLGDHCTAGHATEVKNSIFMDHTEAGHFAYIGDSILGRYVNLGAGTKLANLPFRTMENKQQVSFPALKIHFNDTLIQMPRGKFGVVLGDGVETGCNTSLSPCTFFGPDSWIYPCVSVPRGFYPGRSLIKPGISPQITVKENR